MFLLLVFALFFTFCYVILIQIVNTTGDHIRLEKRILYIVSCCIYLKVLIAKQNAHK